MFRLSDKCHWYSLSVALVLHLFPIVALHWNAEIIQRKSSGQRPFATMEVAFIRTPLAAPNNQEPSPQLTEALIPSSIVPSPPQPRRAETTSDEHRRNVFVLPPQELLYLPSSELDIPPQATAPIIIPFPDASVTGAKMTAVLQLFVGLDGRIDRIEIEESDLPSLFEKAAVDTFKQAKMLPGIKEGRNTRARMKILVEFEAK